MATKYVDLNNGNDANDGSTFALRKKTLSSAAAVAAAGDTVRVMGKPSTSSSTATWTNNSSLVTLAAAIGQLLYADGAWTAVTNITCTAPTSSPSPKQGSNSAKMAANGTFTTGKVAHFPTGAALNLSGFQQVTFWIQCSTTLASGALSLNLCSDTTGNTIVDTLTLNVALGANKWTAVTINKGSALGASIQSIRLTANTAITSKNISIDNVVACKSTASADQLTLNTLISPDNVTWYPVQSINGTSVYIDAQQATAATAAKGYQGATGSSTFYMLQPTQVTINTASSSYAQVFSANGAVNNPITISGGWDTTAMTTQDGWTTIDMMDWTASGVNLSGTTGYITVDKFNFARCAFPLGLVANSKGYTYSNGSCAGTGSFSNMPTHGVTVTNVNFLNCSGTTAILNVPSTANYNTDQVNWNISSTKVWGASVGGIQVPSFIGSPAITISGCDCSGNTGNGFNISSICNFRNNTAKRNTSPGFYFQNMMGFVGYSLVSQNNTTAEVQLNNADVEIYTLDTNFASTNPQINVLSGAVGKAVVYNWTQYTGGSPLAKLTSLGDPVTGQTAGNSVASHKEGGVANNNSIYSDYGTVTTTGVVGQSGSGIGWKLSPNVNAFASSPLSLNIGKVACPANVQTTVTYYAKFSAVGPTGQLKVAGGRYTGVGSAGTDITVAVAGTAWTQYSLSFTPTEACVVDVYAEVWGSSTQNMQISGPVTVVQ